MHENGIGLICTPEYAPWFIGEQVGRALIICSACFKKFCTSDLNVDSETNDSTSISYNWPDHLDEAVHCLNDCVIPALNATCWEILFGIPFRLKSSTLPTIELPEPTTIDANIHFTCTDLFCFNIHPKSLVEGY